MLKYESGTTQNAVIEKVEYFRHAPPPFEDPYIWQDGPGLWVTCHLDDYTPENFAMITMTEECAKKLRDQLNALFPAQAT